MLGMLKNGSQYHVKCRVLIAKFIFPNCSKKKSNAISIFMANQKLKTYLQMTESFLPYSKWEMAKMGIQFQRKKD